MQRKASRLGIHYAPWEQQDGERNPVADVLCEYFTEARRQAVAELVWQVRTWLQGERCNNLWVYPADLAVNRLDYIRNWCRSQCKHRKQCVWQTRQEGHWVWQLTEDVAAISRRSKTWLTLTDRVEELLTERINQELARDAGYNGSAELHDFVIGWVGCWYTLYFKARKIHSEVEEQCGTGYDLIMRVQPPGEAAVWWVFEIKTGHTVNLTQAARQLQTNGNGDARPLRRVLVLPWYRQPYGGFPPDITVVTFQQLGLPLDLPKKWRRKRSGE